MIKKLTLITTNKKQVHAIYKNKPINYKTNSTLGYDHGRDTLYLQIERSNGQVKGIYTNYSVTLPDGVDPSIYLYENGLNCEHVWPQSMYEGDGLMESDMHHLRPCKENVNSSRGNKPFDEITDSQTDHWYWQNQNISNIPSTNIDEYSESSSSAFEPREDRKGDIARSMYYFYTIYNSVINSSFFEPQKDVLYQWHLNDPPSTNEIDITWAIADYQDNIPNPFILDDSLIYRAFFYASLPGDITFDNIVNVSDIVFMVSIILDDIETTSEQFTNADLDENLVINVADIVALVNIILS